MAYNYRFEKGLILVCLLFLTIFTYVTSVSAVGIKKVEGYAWSSNIGWISFNCSGSLSCASSNYGVTLDTLTGNMAGQAWNPYIGWISFDASDVTGCPLAPCAPKLVGDSVVGWARALSGDSENGWAGWIHLTGSEYGVTFDGEKFNGFSWSDDVIGWIDWQPGLGPGVYIVTSSNIITGISSGGPLSRVHIGSDVCGDTTCSFIYETGEVLDLVANSGTGYIFSNWTGPNVSECRDASNKICSGVLLDADKEIRAVFRTVICPSDGLGYCPVCNDGVDNDGDGEIDFPADHNCSSLSGSTETLIVPLCNDCLDNDGDGKIDWVSDTGCNGSPTDTNENNALLSVSVIAEGVGVSGKVVSSPTGIDCGLACSKEYLNDETVTLTAIPQNKKTVFASWFGYCSGTNSTCIVPMTISRSVTARFVESVGEPESVKLKLNIKYEGKASGGSILIPYLEELCGSSCSFEVPYGLIIGLSAKGDTGQSASVYRILSVGGGSVFWRWTGDCTGVEPTCESLMDRNKNITAVFGEKDKTPKALCPSDGPTRCPVCNDGVDNDGDGKIDYPADSTCGSSSDIREGRAGESNCPADGPGNCPVCLDGLDNDGDGITDFKSDLGCSSRNDSSESVQGAGPNCPADGPGKCPQCNDGVDNDSDGLEDLSDSDCEGDLNRDSELGAGPNCPADGPGKCPQCNDGVDNDGDKFKDYPSDPGCFGRGDNNETDPVISGNCPKDGPGKCPQCNDGVDNDGDGPVDWLGWDADKDGTREIERDSSCQGEPNKNTESGEIKIIEI